MKNLKFKYTILYVDSVENTLKFYESAFGLRTLMLHENGDYGALDTGETTLSFSSLKLMSDLGKKPTQVTAGQPSFEIAFETNDVSESLAKALSAGASLVQEVEHMP